jgi:hypothetical protein
MDDLRRGFQRRARIDERRDLRRIAEEPKFAAGVAGEREIGAGYNDGGAAVAPHRIKRNADLI